MATIRVVVTVHLDSGASQPWSAWSQRAVDLTEREVKRAIGRRRAEWPGPMIQDCTPLDNLLIDACQAAQDEVRRYAERTP